MKHILLFTQLTFFSAFAVAQNVEFEKANFPDQKAELKEARRNIDEGDKFYEPSGGMAPDYASALQFYLKANNFNPNNALLNYRIGRCYLESPFPQKATAHLEKALALNPNIGGNIHFFLGYAYHLNMEWEKAIKEYQTCKSILKPEEKVQIEEADKKIQECKNGMELVKNPVPVFIDNLGPDVNSPERDYSPLVTADESVLIFTSRRSSTTGGGKAPEDNMYWEDIYITSKEGDKWTTSRNMGKPVNRENQHDAPVALSADGQKLFIYIDENGGDIYECDQRGITWSKPSRLNDNINTKYHESSASISSDNKTLYFVSDKEGGLGQHDIYKSVWDEKKQKWGEAINLGPTINTQYDEKGVFIHPDGKTLYFSSKGHNTMGELDIFKSVWDEKKKKWSIPENLGYPINTPDSDFDFVLSASGKHAYYSAFKQDGYGEQDIYMITFITPKNPVLQTEDNLLASLTEPIKETVIAKEVVIPTAVVSILKGTIFDAVTKQPLEADIEMVDNQLNQVIATFKSNSATGKFLVSLPAGKNYGIAVKKENYLFHSENFDIPAASGYQEYVKDIGLKNVAVGQKIVLRNIFFDFDKATLRPESTSELERLTKLLQDVPSMKIEIGGHTDSKGSDEYNMKLSGSRAQSVVDYLVSKGIDKSRLTSKGYGETKPMADNNTEEGRQLNRRTEFEIISK